MFAFTILSFATLCFHRSVNNDETLIGPVVEKLGVKGWENNRAWMQFPLQEYSGFSLSSIQSFVTKIDLKS